MATLQLGIPTQLHLDARVRQTAPVYTINRSGDDVTYTVYTANSTTPSYINFNFPVNNTNTYIDRRIALRVAAFFQFTGTPVIGSIPPAMFPNGKMNGTDGLRWCPLQSNSTSVQLILDNQNVTYESSVYLEPLSRYGFDVEADDSYISTFPSMHDQFNTYPDGFNTNRNPLGEYGDNTTQQSRGAFRYEVLADTGVAATIRIVWTELVMISPLVFTRFDQKGFFGLQNFGLNLTLGPFANMWSHDDVNGCGITSITGTFDGQAQLRICSLTPSYLDYPADKQLYPYTQIYRNTTIGPIIGALSSTTIESVSIQMKDIPTRIYIIVRKSQDTKTITDTDTYLTITNLSVNWNNRSGMLSGATPEDLYIMSANNGLKMSWNQWDQFVGSVMCVDFGKDIGMNRDESVGLEGTYNLQLRATVRSNYTVPILSELVVVQLDEGVCLMEMGRNRLFNGMLTKADVESSRLEKSPMTEFKDITTFFGGGLAGTVLKGAAKTGRFLKSSGRDLAKDVYHLGKEYVPKFRAAGLEGGEMEYDNRRLLVGMNGRRRR